MTAITPFKSSLSAPLLVVAALALTLACSEDQAPMVDAGSEDPWGDLNTGVKDTTKPADTNTGKLDATETKETVQVKDTAGDTVTMPDIVVADADVVSDAPAGDPDAPDTTTPDAGGGDDGGASGSCVGKCGKFENGATCQCDTSCKQFGDCCADIDNVCGGDATQSDAGEPDAVVKPDVPPQPINCATLPSATLPPATAPGTLVVSEILINPKGSTDEFGEWFEIYNTTDKCVPLGNLLLADGVVDVHKIGGDTLFIAPKSVMVFGPSKDLAKNGNVKVDYVYNNFLLGNLTDGIILKTSVGAIIDEVKWTFPVANPALKHLEWPMIDLDGKAANLSGDDLSATSNDQWQSKFGLPVWCLATTQWGVDPVTQQPVGDYGTPGVVNPICKKPPDTDKDGVPDSKDICPNAADPNQEDTDKDGVGDACDNCKTVPNKAQENLADGGYCFPDQSACDKGGDACDKQECGDGEPDKGEECDDANSKLNDGCEACKVKAIVPAKIFITELFIDTNQVQQGRWIEIHSKDPQKITLTGWTIQTSKGFSHTIQGQLEISNGQTMILGDTKSQLWNGKVPVDYAWATGGVVDIQLDTKQDSIEIINNGAVIDKVNYGGAMPLPKTGVSLQLDNKFYDAGQNNNGNNWCDSTEPWLVIPGSDLGSPGKMNVTCTPSGGDKDKDGVKNGVDNCIYVSNPQQEDGDNDGAGDACDNCKVKFNQTQSDGDGDGFGDACDNCVKFQNPLQIDSNKNGWGDKCDSVKCGDGQLDIYEECDDGNKVNCDGCTSVCHKEAFSAGQILVSEMMVAPKTVKDPKGEWFEVHNPTGTHVDLNGWKIKDKGGTNLTISAPKPVIVPAGGYAVLGANGDELTNGGVKMDYVYGAANFKLSNLVGSVIMECNNKVIDEVSYWLKGALCNGPNNPPGCATNGFEACLGKSQNLEPSKMTFADNDKADNWCCGKKKFGLGDLGSPGKPNPSCINPCVDPITKDPKPDKTKCDPTGKLFWCIKGECVDQPKCGDGDINQDSEQCDDGNNDDGDGCTSNCTIEEKPQEAGTLIISEMMINPDANGSNSDAGEWFELYNPTNKPIDLLGWTIADEPRACQLNKGKRCNFDEDCQVCEMQGFECKKDKDGKIIIKTDYGKCNLDPQTKADKYTFKASCGDGRTNGNEECDDGNKFGGDGCSGTCTTEGVCTSLSLDGVSANVGIVKLVNGAPKRLPFGEHLLIHGWFLLESAATIGQCADKGVEKACSHLFSYGLADEYHIAVRSMDNKLWLEVGTAAKLSLLELGPVKLKQWSHLAVMVRRDFDSAKVKTGAADPYGGKFTAFVDGEPSAELFRDDWNWSPGCAKDGSVGASKVTLGGQGLGSKVNNPMKGRVARFHVTDVPHLMLPFGPQAVWKGAWKGGTFNGNIVRLALDEGAGSSLKDKAGNDVIAGNSGGVWASPAGGNPSGPYCVAGGKLLADTKPIKAGANVFVIKPFSRAVVMSTYNTAHRNGIDGIVTFADDLSGGFFSLDNNPDAILLINPAGKEIDRVAYNADQKWKWSVGVSAMLKPGGCHDTKQNDTPACWVGASLMCSYGLNLGSLLDKPKGCSDKFACFADSICSSAPSPGVTCGAGPKGACGQPSCCVLPDRGSPGRVNTCP